MKACRHLKMKMLADAVRGIAPDIGQEIEKSPTVAC